MFICCAHQELSLLEGHTTARSPCSLCPSCSASTANIFNHHTSTSASAVLTKNCLLEGHTTAGSPRSLILDHSAPTAGWCACCSTPTSAASAVLTKSCLLEGHLTARSPCSQCCAPEASTNICHNLAQVHLLCSPRAVCLRAISRPAVPAVNAVHQKLAQTYAII
jgi:hypothetical protein